MNAPKTDEMQFAGFKTTDAAKAHLFAPDSGRRLN